MSHIRGFRTSWLAAVFLAVLTQSAALADSPSRDDGEVKEESTADPIVGSWRLVKSAGFEVPRDANVTVRFDKEGKVAVKVSFLGRGESHSGTYKVDGKKLPLVFKGQKAETATIKKLDDSKLVVIDTDGKETEFKKTR